MGKLQKKDQGQQLYQHLQYMYDFETIDRQCLGHVLYNLITRLKRLLCACVWELNLTSHTYPDGN